MAPRVFLTPAFALAAARVQVTCRVAWALRLPVMPVQVDLRGCQRVGCLAYTTRVYDVELEVGSMQGHRKTSVAFLRGTDIDLLCDERTHA